MIEFMLYEGLA